MAEHHRRRTTHSGNSPRPAGLQQQSLIGGLPTGIGKPQLSIDGLLPLVALKADRRRIAEPEAQTHQD